MLSAPLDKTLRRLKRAADAGEIPGILHAAVKVAASENWTALHASLPPHSDEDCLKVCVLNGESTRLGFMQGAFHILVTLGLVSEKMSLHDLVAEIRSRGEAPKP